MLMRRRQRGQWISFALLLISSLLLFDGIILKENGNTPQTHCFDVPENFIEKKIPPYPVLELGPGVSSNDGLYMRHPHVWPLMRETGQAGARVCLATQTSVDRISSLPWILKTWTGPISVAVFTPGTDFQILSLMVQYLAECFPELNKRISFHVLYPITRQPIVSHNFPLVDNLSCSNSHAALSRIYTEMSALNNNSFLKHPQNHLRNLARQACNTSFSLSIDIDLIPSFGMFERLNLFLEGVDCQKCAFVVPAYEILESQKSIPANKVALLQLIWIEDAAQSFYKTVLPEAHATSYPDQWEREISNKGDVPLFLNIEESPSTDHNTSLSAPYKELFSFHRNKYTVLWEPFLVLPSNANAWDERFVGFGCDRNSQIFELFLHNYRFPVLDEAFVIHIGYKVYDKKREMEQMIGCEVFYGHRRKFSYGNR